MSQLFYDQIECNIRGKVIKVRFGRTPVGEIRKVQEGFVLQYHITRNDGKVCKSLSEIKVRLEKGTY